MVRSNWLIVVNSRVITGFAFPSDACTHCLLLCLSRFPMVASFSARSFDERFPSFSDEYGDPSFGANTCGMEISIFIDSFSASRCSPNSVKLLIG